jgi:putative mRNA 3-end processing factor
MLGAVQVLLETADGRRLGYSGDFHWPADEVMQVDELVVDSTYGNEGSIREYSQEQAETSFLQLVYEKLSAGCSHQGTSRNRSTCAANHEGQYPCSDVRQ